MSVVKCQLSGKQQKGTDLFYSIFGQSEWKTVSGKEEHLAAGSRLQFAVCSKRLKTRTAESGKKEQRK